MELVIDKYRGIEYEWVQNHIGEWYVQFNDYEQELGPYDLRSVAQRDVETWIDEWLDDGCNTVGCTNKVRYTSMYCGICDVTKNGGHGRRISR